MAIRIFNINELDFGDVQANGQPGVDETMRFVDQKGNTVMELVSDADGTKTLTVGSDQVKFFPNIVDDGTNVIVTLPTEDPLIAGALWNDEGIVTVSEGPVEEEEE
jgi:hypothetical protein